MLFRSSQALNQHVEDLLTKNVTKYFDNAISADVHFKKEGAAFHCNIIVNDGVSGGKDIKADYESHDIYKAFNEACDKIETQLRRYKRKLSDK